MIYINTITKVSILTFAFHVKIKYLRAFSNWLALVRYTNLFNGARHYPGDSIS